MTTGKFSISTEARVCSTVPLTYKQHVHTTISCDMVHFFQNSGNYTCNLFHVLSNLTIQHRIQWCILNNIYLIVYGWSMFLAFMGHLYHIIPHTIMNCLKCTGKQASLLGVGRSIGAPMHPDIHFGDIWISTSVYEWQYVTLYFSEFFKTLDCQKLVLCTKNEST